MCGRLGVFVCSHAFTRASVCPCRLSLPPPTTPPRRPYPSPRPLCHRHRLCVLARTLCVCLCARVFVGVCVRVRAGGCVCARVLCVHFLFFVWVWVWMWMLCGRVCVFVAACPRAYRVPNAGRSTPKVLDSNPIFSTTHITGLLPAVGGLN